MSKWKRSALSCSSLESKVLFDSPGRPFDAATPDVNFIRSQTVIEWPHPLSHIVVHVILQMPHAAASQPSLAGARKIPSEKAIPFARGKK
jgi:hypothetical protein